LYRYIVVESLAKTIRQDVETARSYMQQAEGDVRQAYAVGLYKLNAVDPEHESASGNP
jgi:hypothetical protein